VQGQVAARQRSRFHRAGVSRKGVGLLLSAIADNPQDQLGDGITHGSSKWGHHVTLHEKHLATKELLYFLSEESVRILLLYLSAQNERRSVHTGYALNAHLPRGQLVENKGSG